MRRTFQFVTAFGVSLCRHLLPVNVGAVAFKPGPPGLEAAPQLLCDGGLHDGPVRLEAAALKVEGQRGGWRPLPEAVLVLGKSGGRDVALVKGRPPDLLVHRRDPLHQLIGADPGQVVQQNRHLR